jgi:lipoprotein NlpI
VPTARYPYLLLFALLCAPSVAQESSEALLTRAMAAYRQGEVDEAFTLSDRAIAIAPGDPTGYFIRGTVFESRREYEKALSDYDRVVELSPTLPLAFGRRGGLRFKLEDFDGAISDFDREVSLDPAKGNNHWQRGIAHYYAKRYKDCRQQFELSYKTVNPNDYENGIFHFLCMAKEQGEDKARKSMLKIQGDERLPMKQIYDLYGGRGSVQTVLMAAEEGGPVAAELNDRLFYGHLYVGLYLDATGQAPAARRHLSRAVENFPVSHFMWDVGRVQLAALADVAPDAPTPAEAPVLQQKAFRDPKPPKLEKPTGAAPPASQPHPTRISDLTVAC